MYNNDTLLIDLGRWFERQIFGLTNPNIFDHPKVQPEMLSLERSIQQQIKQNWKDYSLAMREGKSYVHNPSDPHMGETRIIWEAVKKALNKRWPKEDYHSLKLFISVGYNSLDYHYGVDLFFWWGGVYATVDLALSLKRDEPLKADLALSLKRDKRHLKADLIFTPQQMFQPFLGYFGRNVANLLIQRKEEQDKEVKSKQRKIK